MIATEKSDPFVLWMRKEYHFGKILHHKDVKTLLSNCLTPTASSRLFP